MKKENIKKFLYIIIVLVAIDQIIKISILILKVKIVDVNAFGIGILSNEKTENNITYIFTSIIAILLIIKYIMSNNSFIKNDSRIILSFAIAGAISNTIDRIWNGATINYINIPKFTQINIAYIYFIITWIGMAAILTKYTRERMKEKKQKRNEY